MGETRVHELSPSYPVDLRTLTTRAFGEAAALPPEPVRGGTIQERLEATVIARSGHRVRCSEIMIAEDNDAEVSAGGISKVTAADYLELSLPHRLLILGPLLDLASAEIEWQDLMTAEEQLLRSYRESYLYVPLPPDILQAVKHLACRSPEELLLTWLDFALSSIVEADALEQAMAVRNRCRMDALRRGSAGRWAEDTVCLAELMTDVFVLCYAAKSDVDAARLNAPQFHGSVAVALQRMDQGSETVFEDVLPSLLRSPFTLQDIAEEEQARIIRFATSRSPEWRKGLLSPAVSRPPPKELGNRNISVKHRSAAQDAASKRTETPPESARECYRRLRSSLEGTIIGRPALCRRLALVGVAHLQGVRLQRVLLCGPTGCGKTHAAKALTKAIEQPFLHVDMADITATGWKGSDLPDVLSALMRDSKGGPAILFLDEIDKVRTGKETYGNSAEAKANLQGSLLALLDGRPITTETFGRDQLKTSELLVIGTGAFGGLFTSGAPSTDELVEWGWMPELAARWTERFCLPPPSRKVAIELLRKSDRSIEQRLGTLLAALQVEIEVPPEVFAYVADTWIRKGTDFRTAAEWLITAARRRLIDGLEQGDSGTIVLAPDDIG